MKILIWNGIGVTLRDRAPQRGQVLGGLNCPLAMETQYPHNVRFVSWISHENIGEIRLNSGKDPFLLCRYSIYFKQ